MLYKRFGGLSALLTFTAFFLAMGAAPAWGHDFNFIANFNCIGSGCSLNTTHEDASPFKGWAYFTLTNTGSEPWGDFHFELFQVTGNIANVFFQDNSPYAPQSTQNITWVLSPDGHTLDLYFYGDPVAVGNTASFNIYTNNTLNQVSFFGTLLYPTPVPEPGTAVLVGFGLLGLVASARRLKA